jgi:pyrroloquinoline-quinone synthase
MSNEVWDRIEAARARWNVLDHPFYRRWSAGELSGAELARYAEQYRHAVEAIATATADLAEAEPDRPELRSHAVEEAAHVELWDQFLTAAGGGRKAPANPETLDCVATWTDDHGTLPTLGRLYAIESGQPPISRIKRQGLVERYGFEEGPATAYFRVHETRDDEHAAGSRAVIEELIATEGDADAIVAAASAALRANWRLLDGVEARR